jgi:amino acid adenylation domain-containing protein
MNKSTNIPLSDVQQRFWFLQQMESYQDNAICVVFQTQEILDQELLQQRLNGLLEHNDTLRRVVGTYADNVVQEVSPDTKNYRVEETRLADGEAAFDLDEQIARSKTKIEPPNPPFRVDLLSAPTSSILILTASRIFSDVYSLELAAAHLLGVTTETAHPAPDFSSRLDGDPLAAQSNLEKWARALQDATFVCELPLDKTRPAFQKGLSASYEALLSSSTLASIEKLNQRYGLPPSIVALAAYFTLIYRYTLQDDLLIGLAARAGGSFATSMGPFTDTVVFRQKFEEGATFLSVLESLRAIQADLDAAPPPSFSRLLETLKPERDLSRAPLVQHGFEFLASSALPPSDDLRFKRLYVSPALSQLDVMLCIRVETGCTSANWHYDTAIFSAETIRRLHGHLEALLASAAENADRPVKHLELLAPAEREIITREWNATTRPVKDPDFIYRLFEKQAERTPAAIAAREPGKEITYAALNRRANRLAHQLAEKGIGADSIVPILADREIDYLTTILAINKAGGAFLPLSPSYPARRLAQIFEKSDSTLVLVGTNYLDPVREAMQYLPPERLPRIEMIPDILAQAGPETNLPTRCEMHHLAYVMFTSGSTGEPKGVMVHHAGNINHIYAKITDLEMGPEDILAQTSRQSFDIVVWQFLAPLINGGSIYIMPDEIALDPAQLLQESDKVGVTVLQLVPVNIEALLDVADAMAENRPKLTALRWMVPTGDALPTDLCRRWLHLYPHIRMLNTYGATECSDDQCHHVIATPPPAEYRPAVMTIGRPIINTQVYVLDDLLHPVPVGVLGELYIAGVGVGRGYLKDAERTAKTFVPNPFSDDPNTKLYRSGDLARYLPDGTVEFIGRIGHMIKIRGVRIEPGEIQSVLGRHPQVAQATLVVHEFPGSGSQLVAFIVYRKGEVVAESDLRAYLRQYLPDYMIPAYFVVIDAMPLNANGKIDRKALPIPDHTRVKSSIVAPRNDTENALLAIWSSILKRNELSIQDNFFEVGGHSLLAMQLCSQIERQFGQRLPLKTIFRASTIAALAELLNSNPANQPASDKFAELSCIVPIQTGNPARTPFFFLHAAGGHVIYINKFASFLDKQLPFYGIQAVGIDGNQAPLNRFEDLAAVYVREIRTVQPEGPYYLGGESMGASIAFEVARQLEEQGQTIGLFALFDASFPSLRMILKPGIPRWVYRIFYNLQRLWRLHLPELFNLPWGEKKAYAVDLARRFIDTLPALFFGEERLKPVSNDPTLKVAQTALIEAREAYRPGQIRAPITLFSSELPWGAGDEALGWREHTLNGVEILHFSILWDTMLEGPQAKLVAERFQKVIDQKIEEQQAKQIS